MRARPLLLGHRGARADKSVPENTLASFDLALAAGCDGFEFDVRLAGDGQAVVCHDATSDRRKVSECAAATLGLPLLGDVLARYQETAFLDIELKVAGLESVAARLLKKYPPERGFVVSSFLPEVIEALRGIDAELPLGLICETESQLECWPRLPVQSVILHRKLLRPEVIGELKAAGLKTLAWTVNAPAEMKRFSQWGVDGIISDSPEKLFRACDQNM